VRWICGSRSNHDWPITELANRIRRSAPPRKFNQPETNVTIPRTQAEPNSSSEGSFALFTLIEFFDIGLGHNITSSFISSLYVIARPSVACRLSETFVHPTQTIEKFLAMFLRHLVRWPSVNIQVKFYADRPKGTPPSGELNRRGVAEYSDFGPIERYISETVQDRS